jgi:hypothetical protein
MTPRGMGPPRTRRVCPVTEVADTGRVSVWRPVFHVRHVDNAHGPDRESRPTPTLKAFRHGTRQGRRSGRIIVGKEG